METHNHQVMRSSRPEPWMKRHRWVTYIGLAILAYFLFMEHRDHVLPYLPFLILLACPFMHLFMHHGHNHGSHTHNEREKER